jgi:hypothetical protein
MPSVFHRSPRMGSRYVSMSSRTTATPGHLSTAGPFARLLEPLLRFALGCVIFVHRSPSAGGHMAPRMPSAHPTSHCHWSSAIRLALTTIHAPMSFVTSSSVEIAPISLGERLNGDSEGVAENTSAVQWFGRLRRVLHPLLERGQLGVRWVRCQPSRRARSALRIWSVSAAMKWPWRI